MIFPDSTITMKLLGFINNTYKVDGIKNMTRLEGGTSSTKLNITGFEQNIPQGDTWKELLNDNEYKDQLTETIKQYVLEFSSRILPRSFFFITTSSEKDYFYFASGNKVTSVCNHEEADTCLVSYASKVDSDVVVVCKDTFVFILMIWAYPKLKITNNWYLKYDHKEFADIRKICSYLGKTLSLNLPKIHALTGCDTTPYFYFTCEFQSF